MSYGLSIVRIWDKTDCVIIMVLLCNYIMMKTNKALPTTHLWVCHQTVGPFQGRCPVVGSAWRPGPWATPRGSLGMWPGPESASSPAPQDQSASRGNNQGLQSYFGNSSTPKRWAVILNEKYLKTSKWCKSCLVPLKLPSHEWQRFLLTRSPHWFR